MKLSMYNSMVDDVWDYELSQMEKDIVVKAITGVPSHYKMNKYVKSMRNDIRKQMIELNYVVPMVEL